LCFYIITIIAHRKPAAIYELYPVAVAWIAFEIEYQDFMNSFMQYNLPDNYRVGMILFLIFFGFAALMMRFYQMMKATNDLKGYSFIEGLGVLIIVFIWPFLSFVPEEE